MPAIPASAYRALERTSPALDLMGPWWSHGHGRELSIGLRVEPKHCNARGTVHGGILAVMADVALGYVTAFAEEPPLPLVTSHLSLDYAGAASVGDWLHTRVDIQKRGRSLAFAQAYIFREELRIVHASAVFAVVARA